MNWKEGPKLKNNKIDGDKSRRNIEFKKSDRGRMAMKGMENKELKRHLIIEKEKRDCPC